jgi:recombination protein RecT
MQFYHKNRRLVLEKDKKMENPQAIAKIKTYAMSPEVVATFRDVSGSNAMTYISSALLAVRNSDKLQACTPISIMSSALQLAMLRLSCDPGLGHAYLVPYGKSATHIIGYKGLKEMALRTGKYRHLNVARIYEGENVQEDRIKGVHSLVGSRTGDDVIGYLLYFELLSGYSKTVYMTTDEIKDHAEKYSPSCHRDDSPWQTNFDDMCRKTVLRQGLTKWGYLDPYDRANLANDGVMFELPMESTVTVIEEERISASQAMDDLYGVSTPSRKITDRPAPELNAPAFTAPNLAEAIAFQHNKSIPFGDMSSEDLAALATDLAKEIKISDPVARVDLSQKLTAAKLILASRS